MAREYTDRQKKLITLLAQGVGGKEAGIQAGYSANTAKVMVSQLRARPDIKAAIKALKDGKSPPMLAGQDSEKPRMKDSYASSLALMKDTYNNPAMPYSVRFEAAKQALPYEHAKLGEQGKKQQKDASAADVARGKFAPKSAPTGNVVALRK